MKQNNQINRQKASSHPFKGDGVFIGEVKSVVSGLPVIFVRQLNCTFNDVRFLGRTTANSLKANDRVLCTFVDNQTQELFVLGAFNNKKDVFVTVEKFNALIDQLETQINAVRAALVPPLPPIDLESFKQEQP